jgi:hypothetical protein
VAARTSGRDNVTGVWGWIGGHFDRVLDWGFAAALIFFAYRVARSTRVLQVRPRPQFAFAPQNAAGVLSAQVYNVGGAAWTYFALVHYRKGIHYLKSSLPAQAPQSAPLGLPLALGIDSESTDPKIIGLVAQDLNGHWWDCEKGVMVSKKFDSKVADAINQGLPDGLIAIFFVRPKPDGNFELVKYQ